MKKEKQDEKSALPPQIINFPHHSFNYQIPSLMKKNLITLMTRFPFMITNLKSHYKVSSSNPFSLLPFFSILAKLNDDRNH